MKKKIQKKSTSKPSKKSRVSALQIVVPANVWGSISESCQNVFHRVAKANRYRVTIDCTEPFKTRVSSKNILILDIPSLKSADFSALKHSSGKIILLAHQFSSLTDLRSCHYALETVSAVLNSHHLALFEKSLSNLLKLQTKKIRRGFSDSFVDSRAKKQKFKLKDFQERNAFKLKAELFFTECLQRKSHLTGVTHYPRYLADVLDEFLMNAYWDANPHRMHAARTEIQPLGKDEKIELEFSADAKTFSISVQDNFGTLKKGVFPRVFQFALSQNMETEVNEGPGGAGVGLFMTLKKVALMIFESKPGKFTRATAIVSLDIPLKELQKYTKQCIFISL